jgi:hypothetical protein
MNSWLRTVPLFAIAILITPAAGAAQPAPRCEAAAYRQFDFWVGEWQVHTPDGKLAGTNRIEREYDGCVVHEHYMGAKTYRGESLNTYDAGRKVWHQTWVDNQGLLLLLEGGWRGTSMVLEGKSLDASGTSRSASPGLRTPTARFGSSGRRRTTRASGPRFSTVSILTNSVMPEAG